MIDCSVCTLHDTDPERERCDSWALDMEPDDLGVICPPCPPWSKLGNSTKRVFPDDIPSFFTTFGNKDSALAVMKTRFFKVTLIEEVPEFAVTVDSTGLTGLDRLKQEAFAIRKQGKKWYTGLAAAKLSTTGESDSPNRTRSQLHKHGYLLRIDRSQ